MGNKWATHSMEERGQVHPVSVKRPSKAIREAPCCCQAKRGSPSHDPNHRDSKRGRFAWVGGCP